MLQKKKNFILVVNLDCYSSQAGFLIIQLSTVLSCLPSAEEVGCLAAFKRL